MITNDAASFDSLRSHYLPKILDLIERVVSSYLPPDSALPTMIHYHLNTGGKRLRAIIPLRLAEICNQDPQSLLPFAAACELLHNATLVHDDLQDGDDTRRGLPTVWSKFSPGSAINTGDAMLYLTLLLPNFDQNRSHKQIFTIVNSIIRYTLDVIDGQEREFLLQKVEYPSWNEYFNMVRGKTSGLFCLPIAGAATLLDLNQQTIAELEQAAKHLGVLFQIQDDLLDIYGEKGRNTSCADLREGKISALIVHTLHQLRHEQRQDDAAWLRALLRKPRGEISNDEIERALTLFDDTSVKEAMLELIHSFEQKAVDAVTDPILKEFIASLSFLFCRPLKVEKL